jgi:transketolase
LAARCASRLPDRPGLTSAQLAGTGGVHGNPLKADDVEQLKKAFGFDPKAFFAVPDETKKAYAAIADKGAKLEAEWNKLYKAYGDKYPQEAKELARRLEGKLPDGWEKALPVYKPTDPAVASRKLSETVLTKLADVVPELVSGSADLTGSNLTRWKDAGDFQHPSTKIGTYAGRYFRYGVREHAMGAIMNGMAVRRWYLDSGPRLDQRRLTATTSSSPLAAPS